MSIEDMLMEEVLCGVGEGEVGGGTGEGLGEVFGGEVSSLRLKAVLLLS